MIKRLIATGLITLAITFSSTPVSAKAIETQEVISEKAMLIKNTQLLYENTVAVKQAVKKLNKYVGKTWYVFSGNTPAGWDCSGMTMWFYDQLDVQLEHRASKQQSVGIATKNPKVGDLVVFKYKGYNSAYHVGVYVGDGKMIHAPKKGYRTVIQSVKQFAGKHGVVQYRHVVDTV